MLADDAVRAVQVAKLTEIGWTPEAVRALVADGRSAAAAVSDADIAE